ncbi:MacB family efflux pump subunit [Reyranella sp. CPCC 100927]|uniref:MacB family efflux pump subunit n=1 Tax=Reyranella sp. CPCC 100927 TaxID=2599616 RepID=UPI0011B3BD0D|nr:MacB family efflux pump subunit [Reyranella sp. CPCC 100927]TWT14968.1 MacB family efflux pump subunit [Reyranella sp. CPCC 100927]
MTDAASIEPIDPLARPPAQRAPLIELRDITKTYVRGDVATEVLHGISLDIQAGEFVAIMGASGSGKSTLMNLIGLLDRPTSGRYRFAGEEVSELDTDRRALLRRESFGFIFQQYNLLAAATATENVEVPAIYAGLPHGKRVQRARHLLTTLGLGERLDHRPSQLSGGQQQRVSIARALMNGGSVILADEPTGALDSRSGEEVMRLLHDLNADGHTVLLITHDPDVAAQARRVIEIKDGNIVSDRGTSVPSPATSATPAHQAARGSTVIPDAVEAAKMAMRSLRANLMRTLLTLLGIIIGVASVVAMLAIGDGAKQQVLSRITAMGTDLLLIRPGAPNVRRAGALTATLVAADADAIDDLPNVSVAVPEYPGQVTVRYQSRDYVTQADGTTQFFPQARDWPVASGTFFSESDVKSYAPVVALGQTVVRALFPEGFDPVGTFVLVNNVPFQVIGVMSPKGAAPSGADQDDIVFTPLSTGALRLFGQRYVRSITVRVDDVSKIDDTQEAIRQLLIERHKNEDFQIRNMVSILEAATETQNTLTILLGSIAAISLLVGGIGVMNIMLVSVTERTREIGIRMATGARRFNILLQFNTEALVVCAIGGVIGVIAGLATAWGFAQLGRPVMFSAGPVILAFACAFATGLLFGYLPARKAANLDPVVALAAD